MAFNDDRKTTPLSTDPDISVSPAASTLRGTNDEKNNSNNKSNSNGSSQLGWTDDHVFSDPQQAAHWRSVYEKSRYEGRSRFDPEFTWTASAERAVKRKLDLRIMAWVWIMFSSLDLVRRNINRAVSDNMLDDLHITTNDYNTGQTIFLVTFLAAELPGGLISKKIGPDRMLPISVILWGIACSAQAAMKDRASFFAFRALTGIFQGGFIPEMVLYLSYYYKSDELPIRLSIFWTVIPITQIIGSFLAAGFLEMRGISGWGGWQWLFLIEGLMCIIIGLASVFIMPASVTEGALAFRRKDGTNRWWTEEEEKILVNRILRDDPTKGDLNNRTAVNLKGIWEAMTDVDLWPIYWLGITAFIPFQPVANYLSLTLRNMGYTVFEANMLAIPGFVLFTINILVFGWLSEKLNERSLIAAFSNIWMLPFFIGLVAIGPDASSWVRYVLLTGISGIPYTHSILVGMTSKNAKSVGKRAVSSAVYNICYQIGSIIAANIYRDDDKPYYYTANKALTGLCAANIVFFILMKVFYIWRNKLKERRYQALSAEEKIGYTDLRFSH